MQGSFDFFGLFFHFFGHAGLKSRLRYVTRKEMRFAKKN